MTAIAVLDDENSALVASSNDYGGISLSDLASGKSLRTLQGHTFWVNAIAVLAGGRRALSGSWDKTLRLWDLATGKTLQTLKGHTNGVSALAVVADGSCTLSGSYDNTCGYGI